MAVSHVWALLVLPLIVLASDNTDSNLLVETNTGVVKGKLIIGHTQKEARAFFGIPYAESPVGKLRFKPPIPVTSWPGVFDATQNPLPCYQQNTRQSLKLSKMLSTTVRRPWSEDCLTLSIWTPVLVSNDTPVAVFVHGGGFMTGTGVYPYKDYSAASVEADLIKISINYRLGALGFLSLGTPEIPGNLGLMDQQLALKWIHKNIDKFGGKQDAIFVFGEGAGAASVGYQIMFSGNSGLFKTAVISNGSPTCSWAWQTKEKALEIAKHLSRSLGCGYSNVTVEIECLQNVHPEDIMRYNFLEDDPNTEHFKPNVDGIFIKEQPTESTKVGRFNNMTLVVANTPKGASLNFLTMNEHTLSESGAGLTEEGFQKAIKLANFAVTDSQYTAIRDFYFRKNCAMNSTEIRDAAVDAYTDGFFTCCSTEFLSCAAQNGVLSFRVVYDIPDPRFPTWIGAHLRTFIAVLTGETLNPKDEYGDTVRNWTLSAIRALKVFARTKATEFSKMTPRYNVEDQPYGLRTDKMYFMKNYRKEECVLWNEVLPLLKKNGPARPECRAES